MTTPFKQACMQNSGVVWDGVDGIMIFIGSFVYPLLFIATFIDIAEHPLHTSLGFNTTVMMAQSFILEIGATAFVFQGLAINKQGGKGTAAIWAGGAITVLTLISVAAAILPNSFPDWSSFLSTTDDILLIIRAIISVLYGFVAHILRGIGEKETPQQLQQNNQATQQIETLALMVTGLHDQVKTLSTQQPAPQVDITIEARRIIIEEIRAIVPQIMAPQLAPESDFSGDIYEANLAPHSNFSGDMQEPDLAPEMSNIGDNIGAKFASSFASNQEPSLPPQTRITRPLKETLQEARNASAMSQKRAQTGDSDAAKRVIKIVRRNPNLTAAEIADKAQVSRGYAGKIKAQVLKETSA